jgi:phosphatidylserine/phosphatidylglycerophosphate/cardiolipin synthase-like enzyme
MMMMVQREERWAWILLVAIVLVVSISSATCAQTTVLPLIGTIGSCTYCEYVRDAIALADRSLDILLSNAELDEVSLWDAIVAASDRGVVVRVLLDESDWAQSITDKNRPTIDYLLAHGISARFDDPSVTTHAKLLVIDCRIVILGSTNWNEHSFYDQEQADVSIEDAAVGEVFASYFDRLWNGTLFPGAVRLQVDSISPDEPLIIPLPETVDTENYPAVLFRLVSQARESIHVVMYRISHYPQYQQSVTNNILDALITAAGRGLDVRVYMDDCAFYESDKEANLQAARYLSDHGVDVRMDDPSIVTHAKLVIIDQRTVILGSTNWNYYSLARNNETDIAFIDSPNVAAPYEAFFQQLWGDGRLPGG